MRHRGGSRRNGIGIDLLKGDKMKETPKAITQKLDELDRMVERHPNNIPVQEVADFLGMNADGLRAALITNTAPFGFGYAKLKNGYRVFMIPTVPFYLWYTNTNAQLYKFN